MCKQNGQPDLDSQSFLLNVCKKVAHLLALGFGAVALDRLFFLFTPRFGPGSCPGLAETLTCCSGSVSVELGTLSSTDSVSVDAWPMAHGP